MKKIMSMMLGLSLFVGAATALAAPDDTTKTDKAGKKSGKKKKGDTKGDAAGTTK